MKLLTNKTLKTFSIIFLIIMVIEIIFKFVMDIPVFDWSLFRIMMSAASFSALVAVALSFANNLVRKRKDTTTKEETMAYQNKKGYPYELIRKLDFSEYEE